MEDSNIQNLNVESNSSAGHLNGKLFRSKLNCENPLMLFIEMTEMFSNVSYFTFLFLCMHYEI